MRRDKAPQLMPWEIEIDATWESPGWDPEHWRLLCQRWCRGRADMSPRSADVKEWCRGHRWPVKNLRGRV